MPRVANPNGVSKRQQAYERLRQALVLGQISAGQRLREAEWAERLGVNRAAIREACGRLCVEGLVVEGPKRGYVRTRLSPADAQDALEVRCLLETGAIERICCLGLNDSRRLEPLPKACDQPESLLHNRYRIAPAGLARRDRGGALQCFDPARRRRRARPSGPYPGRIGSKK